MLTGVGAAYINDPIYGLPTNKAEEFLADGLGARYEMEIDRMIVVSMGTGTSLVQCDGDSIEHIGWYRYWRWYVERSFTFAFADG